MRATRCAFGQSYSRTRRSHLHGFDSFLGLPHDWSLEGHKRGYFSTEGVVPRIDDPRVRFYPGWFEDTLPDYEWPEHEVLIVMLGRRSLQLHHNRPQLQRRNWLKR